MSVIFCLTEVFLYDIAVWLQAKHLWNLTEKEELFAAMMIHCAADFAALAVFIAIAVECFHGNPAGARRGLSFGVAVAAVYAVAWEFIFMPYEEASALRPYSQEAFMLTMPVTGIAVGHLYRNKPPNENN